MDEKKEDGRGGTSFPPCHWPIIPYICTPDHFIFAHTLRRTKGRGTLPPLNQWFFVSVQSVRSYNKLDKLCLHHPVGWQLLTSQHVLWYFPSFVFFKLHQSFILTFNQQYLPSSPLPFCYSFCFFFQSISPSFSTSTCELYVHASRPSIRLLSPRPLISFLLPTLSWVLGR